MEEDVVQQQSPLSQARKLEAELPEHGQKAHGEQPAGTGDGGGDGVGTMVGRERKCEAGRNEKIKTEAKQRL